MRELTEHKAYELLKTEYEKTAIDYVILSSDAEYTGIAAHKEAVIEAFRIINIRNADDGTDYRVELEEDKMKSAAISMDEFLQLPDDPYYDDRPKAGRAFSISQPIPYWYAFLEPPYGVPYLKSDLIRLNSALFPNRDNCEVYRWNDDFSDYFNAGKEWWGTGLWSVFDSLTNTIIVIGASLTD